MADLSPRPKRAATSRRERVAELQRLAREDYDSNVSLRAPNVPAPLHGTAAAAVRDQLRETSTTSYDPLYDPEKDTHVVVPPLEYAITRARQVLAEKAQANIHDQNAMIRAASGLHYVLHDLLAALDAERGERR
ncbi:hypothetical protein ACFWOL_15385 [Streptomyces sp. NPDC058442]|uniref:hypothetical protein n=1 Tax=Streptomyces sp. NPDC058442 TaxID=3346503 RepID=UPI003656F0E1